MNRSSLPAALLIFALLTASLWAQEGSAAEILPEARKQFSRIGIQSAGRVMPVASYGESLLNTLSGRSVLAGMNGEDFLFRLFFDFPSLSDVAFIRIYHPDLIFTLGLEKNRHYSINEINPVIETLAYFYQNLVAREDGASSEADPLIREIISLYEKLRHLFLLSSAFDPPQEGQHFEESPLRLIPADGEFMDPRDHHAPAETALWFTEIAQVVEAIPDSRSSSDERLAQSLRELSEMQTAAVEGLETRLAMERVYRAMRPFQLAALLLLVGGFLVYIASKISSQSVSGKRLPMVFGDTAAILGLIFSSTGLLLRLLITNRPPVTNLYSSLLFVGRLLPLLALLVKPRSQRWLFYVAAGGIFLLSPGFVPGSDDLAVLQAVLDNNFWLSVHVVVIMLGYVAVIIASLLGHAQAFALLKAPDSPASTQRYRSMLMSLRLALLLIFIGTMLGGFWADQSWGRFWGWDPKENAALLLILWLSIILHLRPTGLTNEFGLSLFSAASSLVLLFSWFGVNLMAVGLHSYGWNTGSGLLIVIFTLCEAIFLVLMIVRYKGAGKNNDLRKYQILHVHALNDDYLAVELSPAIHTVPGQSITLRLRHDGQPLLRAYSLTDYQRSTFIVQRREGGLAWDYFVNEARPGTGLYGGTGTGSFTLTDPAFGKHTIPRVEVFAAHGIGIAPILSMLRYRAKHAAPATMHLFWALSPQRDEPLREELRHIQKALPQLHIHLFENEKINMNTVISGIEPEDVEDATFYLCGSDGFVNDFEPNEADRISGVWKTEAFTPALNRIQRPEEHHSVLLKPAGTVMEIQAGQSIMEALNQAGMSTRGNCLVGQCGECACNLLSGTVVMDEPNALRKGRVHSGSVLICCAYPESDIELEFPKTRTTS